MKFAKCQMSKPTPKPLGLVSKAKHPCTNVVATTKKNLKHCGFFMVWFLVYLLFLSVQDYEI